MPETNQSLARGLTILTAFSRRTPELGVRELSRRCGISKSIAQRLVHTLAERGFLEQNPDTLRYRLGARLLEIGHQYTTAVGVEDAALPVLRWLTEDHELNAYLGVLRGDRVVYLTALQSRGPIAIRVLPGSVMHLHSTAVGKVLLAALPVAEAQALLGARPLAAVTPATRTDPAALLAELPHVRRRGYSVCDEENMPGVFALGAAVRDRSARVVAGICGACPRYLAPDARIPAIAAAVMAGAARISRALGLPGAEASDRVVATLTGQATP